MVILFAAELAVDITEMSITEMSINLKDGPSPRPFLIIWLGSTLLMSLAFYTFRMCLRSFLVMMVLFKSIVISAFRVYFV